MSKETNSDFYPERYTYILGEKLFSQYILRKNAGVIYVHEETS